MDENKKKLTFLGIVGSLLLVIAISVIYVKLRTPTSTAKNGGTSVVSNATADDGMITVKDFNDGEMKIPKYNVAESSYEMDSFTDDDGIISYKGEKRIGITVSDKHGNIDWQQVKNSGISFAYIRVGFRGITDGKIYYDRNFQENMVGAADAGIDIGVYFYSHSTTDIEAEEEASAVLDKIGLYQVKYPVAFMWEFAPDTAKLSSPPRTQGTSAEQVTRFTKSFCDKIKKAGHKAVFRTDKQMGYEYYNLEALKDFDIWYVEYKKQPAFHYNFKLWEYSSQATVPGIEKNVKITYSFEDYAK